MSNVQAVPIKTLECVTSIEHFVRSDVANKYNRQNLHGKVDYGQLDNETHEIKLTIPPYIIGNNGSFYAFPETELGAVLKSKEGRPTLISVISTFNIIHPIHKHPSVYADGRLDHSLLEMYHFYHRGDEVLRFVEWYDISKERESTAKKIVKVMNIAQRTLEHGYLDSKLGWIPVHFIENCDCKIAEDIRTAQDYAKRNGVRDDRIFMHNLIK